ncbi:MAG: NosD domain-containing protein [Candidatus Methanospirareceae archaeon]
MKTERRFWKCLVVTILLTALTFVCVGVASAATTRYVNPGESIQAAVTAADPGDTIIVRDGTYFENVEVNVANLTLRSEHGSAFTTVLAAATTSDVFLVTANSVTITGFTVQNATDSASSASGIQLHSVQHCNISDNNASGNYNGIYLYAANNNTLTGNTVSKNSHGIYLRYSSSSNTLTGNIAAHNSRGIYLRNSRTTTLVGNAAHSNSQYGIYLLGTSTTTLLGNTANSNSNYGISLSDSNNNMLTGNTALNNGDGIYLYISSNNTLMNNTANTNIRGIDLYASCNNSLTDNTVNSNSNCGILLDNSSDNNTLTGNTASNNHYGIVLDHSNNDNHIYNNYFNNQINAYDDGNNTWNITKTSGANIIGSSWLGGNYWSDYTGEDTTGDGLGDTMLPYNSLMNIQNGGDWLPLIKTEEPSGRWDVNEDCTVNFIDLTILSAHWLETPTAPFPRYDINEDGVVNFIDLTILSAHWLESTC